MSDVSKNIVSLHTTFLPATYIPTYNVFSQELLQLLQTSWIPPKQIYAEMQEHHQFYCADNPYLNIDIVASKVCNGKVDSVFKDAVNQSVLVSLFSPQVNGTFWN